MLFFLVGLSPGLPSFCSLIVDDRVLANALVPSPAIALCERPVGELNTNGPMNYQSEPVNRTFKLVWPYSMLLYRNCLSYW